MEPACLAATSRRIGGLVVVIMWLTSSLSALRQLGQQSCCPPPGDQFPCCIGQWSGPFDLGISCWPKPIGCPSSPTDPPSCGACSEGPEGEATDEIGHAILLPAGAWPDPNDPASTIPLGGKILAWTRCDYAAGRNAPPFNGQYETYLWDPANPAGVVFNPPVIKVGETVNSSNDGPFCSSHIQILDGIGKPKFLVVGGTDKDTAPGKVCQGWAHDPVTGQCVPADTACGLMEAYWFDPLAGDPSLAWGDGVNEPPDRLWYPSVLQFFDFLASEFRLMVLGGSGVQAGAGCGATPSGDRFQYARWWTLSRCPPPQGGRMATFCATWNIHPSGYLWHQYPRAFQLTNGQVVSAGHEIICEYLLCGENDPANVYGGPPVHRIDTGTSPQTLLTVTDPNSQAPAHPNIDVGGWHYCNAVILHTLKPTWTWPINPGDPTQVLGKYDLDRVIVIGGTRERAVPPPGFVFALGNTVELIGGAGGYWDDKAPAPNPCIFGNATLLPDGSILSIGGQDRQAAASPFAVYRFGADRFDPGLPGQNGTWKAMAERPIVGSNSVLLSRGYSSPQYAIPRGYHSVALLLQDGTVAFMGGQPHKENCATPLFEENPYSAPNADPSDSVEIFKPSYTFESGRLKITAFPANIAYGTTACITVNNPSQVDHACLMGLGSVTHHFDFGQRYVQLMTRPCSSGGNIEILPPPNSAEGKRMAPEGYYLLFVVENRDGVRVPSIKGRFVKLM